MENTNLPSLTKTGGHIPNSPHFTSFELQHLDHLHPTRVLFEEDQPFRPSVWVRAPEPTRERFRAKWRVDEVDGFFKGVDLHTGQDRSENLILLAPARSAVDPRGPDGLAREPDTGAGRSPSGVRGCSMSKIHSGELISYETPVERHVPNATSDIQRTPWLSHACDMSS